MTTSDKIFEGLLDQVQQLPPQDRLRLIGRIVETLAPPEEVSQPQRLIYGQFKGERMSTEEDFRLAEWWPTERELNGT